MNLDIVNKLIEGLEIDYLDGKSDREKEESADVVVFILASFLVGLRGEEILKIYFRETKYFLDDMESHVKHQNVILLLRRKI